MKKIIVEKKSPDKELKTTREVSVYQYRNPHLALSQKNVFFFLSLLLFLLAVVSFTLDVVFGAGKNIWVYGYGLFSGLLTFVSIFCIIDRYRYLHCVTSLPEEKFYFVSLLGINMTEVMLFVFGLMLTWPRLVIFFFTDGASTVFLPTNYYADLAQVIISSCYLIIIIISLISIIIFNKKNLVHEKIFAEFNKYNERDFIKDFRPFTWGIILILTALVFFIAPIV